MALLGSDLNSSVPSDADYVRHPSASQLATVLRDLKDRAKDFFNVKFDLDGTQASEALSEESVPASALEDVSPNPESPESGWRSVTVGTNGLVRSGEALAKSKAPRLFRAVFYPAFYDMDGEIYADRNGISKEGGKAVIDTEAGTDVFSGTRAQDPDPFPFNDPGGQAWYQAHTKCTKFRLTLPSRVTRALVTVTGGTPTPYESRVRTYRAAVKIGSPNLTIYVGETDQAPSSVGPFFGGRYLFSCESDYNGSWAKDYDMIRSVSAPVLKETRFTNYGGEGAPGLVIIEWYA